MRTVSWLATAIIGAIALAGPAPNDPPPADMQLPAYEADGTLRRPDGYETWMYIGASLGLSYRENASRKPPGLFHNVYIQREAFEHYRTTGRFPEKTMLALALHQPKQKESINRHGYFQGDLVSLELAVKDSARFAEGWAYFDFGGEGDGRKQTATPFPKDRCYACHSENADDDNVFVQFYPVMRKVRNTK